MLEIESLPPHEGTHYIEFMEKLTLTRSTKRYIEIGVRDGLLLSKIHADFAIGVDPIFALSHNVMKCKKNLFLFGETSDDFFCRNNIVDLLHGRPQIAFLDGLHLFEFLLRDFINVEKLCDKKSLIIAHDCLPLYAEMADRSEEIAKQRTAGHFFHGWWTGDVWKIVPILNKYRPDLKLFLLDAEPTGLLCVTNLDPSNTILEDNYLDIADEFSRLDNNFEQMRTFIGLESRTSTAKVESGFDNTLFFRI